MKPIYVLGVPTILLAAFFYHSHFIQTEVVDCAHLSQSFDSQFLRELRDSELVPDHPKSYIVRERYLFKGGVCYRDMWYKDQYGMFNEEIRDIFTTRQLANCPNALADKVPFPKECDKYNKMEGDIF